MVRPKMLTSQLIKNIFLTILCFLTGHLLHFLFILLLEKLSHTSVPLYLEPYSLGLGFLYGFLFNLVVSAGIMFFLIFGLKQLTQQNWLKPAIALSLMFPLAPLIDLILDQSKILSFTGYRNLFSISIPPTHRIIQSLYFSFHSDSLVSIPLGYKSVFTLMALVIYKAAVGSGSKKKRALCAAIGSFFAIHVLISLFSPSDLPPIILIYDLGILSTVLWISVGFYFTWALNKKVSKVKIQNSASVHESGSAILNVTVLAIFLCGLMLVFLNRAKYRVKARLSAVEIAARAALFEKTKNFILTPSVITSTAAKPVNANLNACLAVDGVMCNATGDTYYGGFTLYDEYDQLLTQSLPVALNGIVPNDAGVWPQSLTQFNGLPAPTPQFDANGHICALGSSSCVMGIFTAFRAWCPYPQNQTTGLPDRTSPSRLLTCDQAEFLQFFVAVGGTVPNANPPLMTQHNFYKGSPSQLGQGTSDPSEILISTNEIQSGGALKCPTGMTMSGLDANRMPICNYTANPCAGDPTNITQGKLIPSFSQDPPGFVCKQPFQGQVLCPNAGEVLYGINADGSANCQNPDYANKGCPDNNYILVGFSNGSPNCVPSYANTLCPDPSLLIGFDVNSTAICKQAEETFLGNNIQLHY